MSRIADVSNRDPHGFALILLSWILIPWGSRSYETGTI
jgi:hypothetical protein